MKKTLLSLLFLFAFLTDNIAEDGYRLWLRYDKIQNETIRKNYHKRLKGIVTLGNSPTLGIATSELQYGLSGLLDQPINQKKGVNKNNMVILGTGNNPLLKELKLEGQLQGLGREGYLIFSGKLNRKKVIIIAGNEDVGVLYGVFHFLRMLQTHQPIENLHIKESPKLEVRILNHWDNLDRTVERGYAGFSIWDWHKLPQFIPQRYHDYARANASIGINGTVLTNVNSNALVLRPDYIEKVKAVADVLRPYGIKVYLTARFSAPIELGKMETADPLSPEVKQWWINKVDEIYKQIPDFGGFLVKANSEGQPGPQNYGRNHVDGANMLADALAPYGGIVMWRAFVYSNEEPEDRAKQAYNEFVPLDGKFRDNVMIQVKNGPIDFQPREPFHPLFGAMKKTPVMMEFQITQEYLGQGTNLVYLAPMYKEVLDYDTHAKGSGSTVAKVLEGSVHKYPVTGMAGVSNIGNDRNWTGHIFGQANWYTFGRLAWNPGLTSEEIAEEWVKMTFSNDEALVNILRELMMGSHETCVRYSTPLGLNHIMASGHHYGPGPWVDNMPRADWNCTYFHRADEEGIGFDRTATGSNAVEQYFPPVKQVFASRELIPDKYLLWFHHVAWSDELSSGNTLWEELCYTYYQGVEEVKNMKTAWESLQNTIDSHRFKEVNSLLEIQVEEAIWWRNSCLLYFQTFSKMPIPEDLEQPQHDLEYYLNLSYPYAPGIRPRW